MGERRSAVCGAAGRSRSAVGAWLLAGLWTLACFAGPANAAESVEPRIAEPEGWVRVTEVSAKAATPSSTSNGGVQYLLFDQQVRVTPKQQSHYRHLAMQVANESGLGSASHVELNFNPAYQTLTLHFVNVRRGTQVIPKLARGAVKVLHRERELEYRVLDGTRTANLFLEDVRVGDVVEYGYTLEGSNPVFGSSRFGRFDLQWSVPVDRLRYRLLWSGDRPVRMLARNGARLAEPTRAGGFEQYEWDVRQIAALTVEQDAPSWYDPYPSVSWGTGDSWREVVEWALPLYQSPPSLNGELSAVVRDIARSHATDEERVAAVLRFAQGHIRYLSVSVGVNSHLPHAPELVHRRRYGDCKDKALLMVSLLRALDIDAAPALVSTTTRRALAEQLPSPGVFDHVIVHVTLDGKVYWLDPTRPTQPGRLAELYQPDYGQALLVRPATTALVSMASPQPRVNRREISSFVDASAGPGRPTTMTVRTVFIGLSADQIRAELAEQPRPETERSYLNFYAGLYPGATAAAPLRIEDDLDANRVVVVEQYNVPDLWHKPEGKARLQATVYASELKEFLRQTRQPVRASPLHVAHPFEVVVKTEINLPQDWKGSASEVGFRSEGFEYSGRAAWPAGNRVVLTDTYRSLADHVAADRVPDHNEKLAKAANALGYTLYFPTGGPATSALGGINWTVALIALFFAALLARLAWMVYRHDPAVAPAEPAEWHLRGIGGWLLLAALAAVFAPIRAARELWGTLPALSLQTWSALTSAGSDTYHPLWAPVLLFELFAQMALLVFGILLLVLFFAKRSNLPRVWIAYCLGGLAVLVVDRALVAQLPVEAALEMSAADTAALVRAVIGNLLWAGYFARSRRVRATFVRRRSETASPPPVVEDGAVAQATAPANP